MKLLEAVCFAPVFLVGVLCGWTWAWFKHGVWCGYHGLRAVQKRGAALRAADRVARKDRAKAVARKDRAKAECHNPASDDCAT